MVLLALVNAGLASGQHEEDHPGELVGRCRVGARLVSSCAQPTVERAERRVAVQQVIAAIFSAGRARLAERLVPEDSTLPPPILVLGHSPSQEQKCLTFAK